MVSRLSRRDPKLRVTVQRMVRGGQEVILGMTRDQQFGPLLMFGLGGVFVEVMRDVSVRVHPLTDVAARGMIQQVKGFPLLAGARGEKPADLDFLEEVLLAPVADGLRLRGGSGRTGPEPVHHHRAGKRLLRRRRQDLPSLEVIR